MSGTEGSIKAAFRTRAKQGETVCGDQCGIWQSDQRLVFAVADGLGHGASAGLAADLAIATVGAGLDSPLPDLFAHCDARLRDTRGVALAVAYLDPATGHLTFASVGNIRAVVLTPTGDFRLGGAWGIVGAGFTDLIVEERRLRLGETLAMYTDGLTEVLPIREVFTATDCSPELAAEESLNRWASGNDDAAILIYCR